MDLHGKHLWEGLARRGHEISIISTRHPSGMEYEESSGIRIHYLRSTSFGSSRRAWKRESLRKFELILESENIDLVVSQQVAGYGIAGKAKNMGLPLLTIMHGYEMMIFRSIFNQIAIQRKGYSSLVKSLLSALYYTVFQEFPLLRKSSRIVAVSDNVGRVLIKRYQIDPEKIIVINYGIDLDRFSPSEETRKATRQKLGIQEGERIILFLSLISKQKGADIILKALNALKHEPNLRLIIAGDGEYLNETKLLTKSLDLESKVLFPGFIENEIAGNYYNAADIFVFPTLRFESFGIVLAEAMACGKPVIASDIGSIPNVIDQGINGILVQPGNPNDLARQISRFLNDPELIQRLSRNAKQKAAERFGLESMIEKTERVLESELFKLTN